MAFYGIPSPGLALTASTAGDTIQLFNNSTAVVSSTTILGLNGNDIINLGAEGYIGSSVNKTEFVIRRGAAVSGADAVSGEMTISGSLFGADVEYSTSTTISGVALVSGATSTTFSGSVTVSGVITSENAVRRVVASQIFGNQDNDFIALGNQLTMISASTIGGGAGNDTIGTYTYISQLTAASRLETANLISNSFIEAGGGNDVVFLNTTGSISTATIQGSLGNDNINVSAVGSFNRVQFLGGGDDDALTIDTDSIASAVSLYGGGGNDIITFTASGAKLLSIAGDSFNVSDAVYDGNDTITVSFVSASSTLVQGGGGNDSITLSGTDAGNNFINANAGNDSIMISNTLFSAGTIAGGAGNDSIRISGGILGGSYVFGGGDKDTIDFVSDAFSGAIVANTTVYGGLGADLFLATGTQGSGTLGVTFGYSSFADSTISAMDSISIGGAVQSGVYLLNYDPAGLAAGSFSAANGAATGTNGTVVFTGTFDTDLTSRVALIDANMTSTGATVTFIANTNQNFVFIQGGTTDLVARIGTANTALNAGITVAGGKLVTLTLV